MRSGPAEFPPISGVCAICEQAAEYDDASNGASFHCRICGDYQIEHAESISIPRDIGPYLSAATRQANQRGSNLVIAPGTFRALAAPHQRTSTTEKLNKLLSAIAAAVQRPGGRFVTLNSAQDYPLADAFDQRELAYYLCHLKEAGLIEADIRHRGDQDIASCGPLMKGWQQVDPVYSPDGEPGRCFIASWLDAEMDEPYANGIEPAVRECGYEPFWMKNIPENKGITDRIISEVRRAQFIVADLTGQRPNVYFEAGFARGLGREVIWCCRADQLDGPDGLHFDIRHFGHVVWNNSAELRTKLADSIRANIVRRP